MPLEKMICGDNYTTELLKDNVNGLIDLSGIEITNPSALDAWSAAYSDAANSIAVINWVGDSLTFGTETETTSSTQINSEKNAVSAPGQLSRLFSFDFGTNVGGMLTPYFTGIDDRVVRSVGMANSTTSGPLGMVGRSDVNGASLTFTTPTCKALDFLFYNNTSTPHTGSFKYTVDGGLDVLVPLSGPFDVNKTININSLTDIPHVFVSIRDDLSNANYWQGLRYHDGYGVCVCRLGRPGWTTSDALGFGELNAGANEDGQARLALGVHAGNPDLTILAFGQNDMGTQLTSGTTVAQYKSNLQRMIDTAPSSVLLISTPNQTVDGTPEGGSPLEDYWSACKELANENENTCHIQLADIYTPEGNADRAVELGYYASGSTIHQSTKGYGSWSRVLHNLLTGVIYKVRT